jgi:hypothetical protein
VSSRAAQERRDESLSTAKAEGTGSDRSHSIVDSFHGSVAQPVVDEGEMATRSPFLLVALLAACVARLPPVVQYDPYAALQRGILRNLKYPSEWTRAGSATLAEGEYREPAARKSATETGVRLVEPIAYGRLADGKYAAGVVLATDPGGSGTFTSLVLVVNEGGKAVPRATVQLGDRVRVRSLDFQRGGIDADVLEPGPTDPLCCPSHERRRRFMLGEDDRLREVQSDGLCLPIWPRHKGASVQRAFHRGRHDGGGLRWPEELQVKINPRADVRAVT